MQMYTTKMSQKSIFTPMCMCSAYAHIQKEADCSKFKI